MRLAIRLTAIYRRNSLRWITCDNKTLRHQVRKARQVATYNKACVLGRAQIGAEMKHNGRLGYQVGFGSKSPMRTNMAELMTTSGKCNNAA
jgi:hypothetical protein